MQTELFAEITDGFLTIIHCDGDSTNNIYEGPSYNHNQTLSRLGYEKVSSTIQTENGFGWFLK